MGGGAAHVDLAVINCKTCSNPITSLPSPPSASTLNFPVSANNTTLAQSCIASETGTGTGKLLGKQDKRVLYKDIFGLVPCQFEVESAIVALQEFLQRISSSSSQCNRLLQMLDKRVEDVFRLLQTDPVIKRLVVSLASDKHVWDAVMNNQMMLQLRKSFVFAAESCRIQSCNGEKDVVSCMLSLIMDIAKAKVTQLIQKFQALMNEILQSSEREELTEENRDEADDRVRSSLLLSIVILLIVVLSRFHGA
ncbi:hypothetical protein JCGZ_14620 [Jatropha curcas]|uniref:Uncharacterized protein n=1 Tax=Jatropha curcas TaxID=180498 RepID=A0A067KAL0_JATCU|nr:uncharacterized protein LOC105643215 [Jatropha curcas]KDP28849.1 hypothetical protein JCGZ_14620 [Jatropha curcas]